MTKTLILMSAVLFSGAGMAQPPVVVTGEAAPTRNVSYDDLNIGSKAGQSRLVNRIRAAASDLCLENNKEDVKFAALRRSCYRTAVSSGIDQMNSAIASRQSGSQLAAATLIISGE